MDVLTDKQYRSYDHISRYSGFPFYYNSKDGKYVYGLLSQLSGDTPYVAHSVGQSDTLDSLALKYYGRPDYYWVIAMFNGISDPFERLYGRFASVKVPTISSISFE